MRGALAIATNAGRNAVDASASGAQVRCRKWGQAQGRALLKRHKGRAGDRRNKIIVVNLRGLVRGPEKITGGGGSRTAKSCGPGALIKALSLRSGATF